MLKSARIAVSILPGKTVLAKCGARLPFFLRTRATARLFSAIASRCRTLPITLDTNLGMGQGLHVNVLSSRTDLIFGAPHLFNGERSSLQLASVLMRQSDCFLDVGSNVGIYIFYMRSKSRDAKPIYFFEPDPDLFARLIDN